MTDDGAKSGELTFSVDSSLLFQLGEQLVAKPSIALAELVKNAYDADATEVTIELEKVERPGGTITVADNGRGMMFEDIQRGWMRIATAAKGTNTVSKAYCRSVTGAKGIGRFAARRLGNKLELQSTAETKASTKEHVIKERVTVHFDWEADFSAGSNLVDIPVSYTRGDVPPCTKTGVSLAIRGVRDTWSDNEIADLRRDLVSLQNPFTDLVARPKTDGDSDCLTDPGFIFKLSVNGVERIGDPADNLDEHLLAAAWATLDGSVDEKGRAHYDLTVHRTKVKESLFDGDNDYTGLEDVHMRIYFMIYAAPYFQDAAIGVRQAQKIGRQDGGVRIYLDGFRVFPYGEQGDDWLQLDYYAARNIDMAKDIAPPRATVELIDSIVGRPFLLIPKNQQLFGSVSLSQTAHSGVGINISRERLIETPTVVRLRRFVQNGIYWMTMRYAAHLAQQRAAVPKNKTKTVTEIIEDARASIAAQADIPEQKRQEVVWSLNSAIERAREDERERISEISMLRVLASAGTTIALMNHQLQALIGAVQETEQDLVSLRPDISPQIYDRYDDITAHVAEWRELVELQISQLGFLLSPDSRQRRKQHALHEVVNNVGHPMSFYMRKYGI